MRPVSQLLRNQPTGLAIIAIVFVASRILYWSLGVRFDMEPLTFYWQYVDPDLLQHDLWRSIFYLDQQPPAFNLLLGTILHLAPKTPEVAFHIIYSGIGLALSLSLYALMVRINVNPRIALIIVLAVTLSPSTLLYENLLFYEYPLASLLCIAALFLHRYSTGGRPLDCLVFFSSLALISGIRALYHLTWFGAIAVLTVVALREGRRRTIFALAIPAAVLVLFYAKHIIVFRNLVPGGRVFGAINLSVMTSRPLPPGALDKLIASGKISPILKTDVFRFVRELKTDVGHSSLARFVPVPVKTGIPVVDECEKSTGAFNWNCTWAANAAKLYVEDSLVALRTYPKAYLQSVVSNISQYFSPDTDGWPFDGRDDDANLQILSKPLRVYNLLTAGLLPPSWNRPWLFYFALPGLLGVGLLKVIGGLREAIRIHRDFQDPAFMTLAFMVFNIVYLSAAVVLFSEGDQNRYRSEVSPYYAVMLGLLLTSAMERVSGKRPL
jgi:hypothetical protein